MADRYTDAQVREQVGTVHALIGQGWSHARIAEHLGISKATVHQRRYAAVDADRKQDEATASQVRHQATREMRGWLSRLDEAYAGESIDVVSAAREATRIWSFLAGLWGANMPVRVDVRAAVANLDRSGSQAIADLLGERTAKREQAERAAIEATRRPAAHRSGTGEGS